MNRFADDTLEFVTIRRVSDGGRSVTRYSPDQPRDEAGRFGSGGAQSPRIHTQGGADGTDHGDPSKHPEIEELRKRILGSGGSKQEVVVVPGNVGPVWISAPHLKHITQQTRQLNKERAKHEEGTPEHERLTARLTELREERARLWREGVKEVREVQGTRALTREEAHAEVAKLVGNAPGTALPYDAMNVRTRDAKGVPHDVHEEIQEATAFLGTVSSVASVGKSPINVQYDSTNRRAYASRGFMVIGRHSEASTVVHEYGHILEYRSVDHFTAAVEFLDRRTRDSNRINPDGMPLNSLLSYGGYGSDEKAWDDRFRDKYVGKAYLEYRTSVSGSKKRITATEVTSMGLQYLYQDPKKFAEEDPDHFRFTIEQLRRPAGGTRP